jgi:hypothetical protein
MPPKIRGMTANLISPKGSMRRFTLMLSGGDALESHTNSTSPPMGLPHERFLLGEQVPLAPVLLLGQSSQAVNPAQMIACLQPVHLHATRDHLILMSQNQIDLTEDESSQLLKMVLPFIEEDFQSTVLYQGHYAWFIPAGPFTSLASHSIDQAHGRNIDWWMPRDTHDEGVAKRWRKLQNEIQMLWHINPINEARALKGLPSINSLWISGIGKLNDVTSPSALKESNHLYGSHPILAGLARLFNIPYSQELNISALVGSFAWLDEVEGFWPQVSQALINKELDELLIIDFPQGLIRERIFTAKDLHHKSWAFWKKAEALTWKDLIR